MKKIITIIVYLGIAVLTLWQIKTETHAQNIGLTDLQINLEFQNENRVSGQIDFTLTNNTETELLEKYELYIPFGDPKNLAVTSQDKKVSFIQETGEQDATKIELDFGDGFIKPGESRVITIKFIILNPIESYLGVNFLSFPAPNTDFTDQALRYTISLPATMGDIAAVIPYAETKETSEKNITNLELESLEDIFILFSQDYSIDILQNFSSQNDSRRELSFLHNLPLQSGNQSVDFTNSITGDFGVTDNIRNSYTHISLDSKDSGDISVRARIKKNSLNPESLQNINYAYDFKDAPSISGEGIEKIINFAEFLNSEFQISDKESSFGEQINFEDKERISTLEYCEVLTTFARDDGYQSNISFGYSIFPSNLEDKKPHFWCNVLLDGEILSFDFYLAEIFNLPYFYSNNEFDKISFGVWNSENDYNNPLGMLGENSQPITTKVTILNFTEEDFTSDLEDISLAATTPEDVFSGIPFDLELLITNDTNMIIPVGQLFVNSRSVTSGIVVSDDLQYSLLPLTENMITLNLREPNFLVSGTKTYDVELILNVADASILSDSIDVEFSIYRGTYIAIGFIALIGLSILTVLASKIRPVREGFSRVKSYVREKS